MRTVILALTLILCGVAIAQDMPEPGYKTMSREELEKAYVAKLEEAAQLRRELAVERAKTAELTEQLAKLTQPKEPESTTAGPTDAELKSAIRDAIRHHELVIGMTVDEARRAMQGNRETREIPGNWMHRERFSAQWGTPTAKTPEYRYGMKDRWIANFVDGKIVNCAKFDFNDDTNALPWPDRTNN